MGAMRTASLPIARKPIGFAPKSQVARTVPPPGAGKSKGLWQQNPELRGGFAATVALAADGTSWSASNVSKVAVVAVGIFALSQRGGDDATTTSSRRAGVNERCEDGHTVIRCRREGRPAEEEGEEVRVKGSVRKEAR